jgi:transcription elongation factor GreA
MPDAQPAAAGHLSRRRRGRRSAGPPSEPGLSPPCQHDRMTTPDNAGEPITEQGLAELKTELGQLETTGRREVARRILTARGHGDLSENAEYHAAKDDQAHLETRIARLRRRLRNAVVVDVVTDSDSDVFSFARPAEIRDEGTGEVHTWTIVGPTEADRSQGKLSSESPVARALLDRAVGDTVEVPTPKGVRRLKIVRLV